MRKYLELFTNGFDETITDKVKVENKPYIGYSMEDAKVVYTVVPKPVVYDPYVTFTAEEDNSSIGLWYLSTGQTMEYSTDTTTWNTFDTTTSIPLNNGDKVYVRGVLSADNTYSDYTRFKMSGKIAASGNCNALWNYQDLNAPLKAFCGRSIFSGCTSLTTAPKLPATTLADSCYYNMFEGCSSLTTAPKILPATTLASGCYQYIFSGCTSLTTVPELPATVLVDSCYSGMFSGCTSLTTAPELPATTLANACYGSMFSGCTSLTTAPELPATTAPNSCYSGMFSGCTSLTTAPELPATELDGYCYSGMFRGCTSLTTAPELPATTLADLCYENMFKGCTTLNNITCLATDISAYKCTYGWVNGIASVGTFIKHPDMNDWGSANYSGIPEGWTVIDAEL